MKRPPRPPRPPFKKTKLDIGWCKRPACTCWTPAGCIGPELTAIYEQTGWIKANAACFPGPCWDYGACVTHQCGSDASCLVHGILQFWIKQYKAVAVWVDPVLAPIAANAPIIQRALLFALPGVSSIIAVRDVLGPPKFRDGCPPGWYWGVGLTGISCQPDGSPQTPATREQLITFGIIPGP